MFKKKNYTPGQIRVRRRMMISQIIFVAFLCIYMGVAIGYANYGYDLLMDWLVLLDASQPDVRSEEVFNQLFGDPDWEKLYEMSGEEDTVYEDVDQYVAYMEALVGDKELTYVETSAGLSGDKKYIVKVDEQKIAEFTLTDTAPEGEEIPDWTLGTVRVFYTRQEQLTIFILPGHKVFINGVPLNVDDYVVATTSTVAEDYLDPGMHGYRDMLLYFDGLLMQPEVTIWDANGTPVEVTYDATTNHYAQVVSENSIPEELSDFVVKAAQTYSNYMINYPNTTLSTCFDTNGKAYLSIIEYERWTMSKYEDRIFTEAVVKDYYRYSDTFYSARVIMDLNVIFNSSFTGAGAVKTFHIDTTFFVRQNSSGNWRVENMTNVAVQEKTTMVKLVYINGNTVIHTEWVPSDASQITLPDVSVPAGKTLAGWATKSVQDGSTAYTLVFAPNETGRVILPENYELTYMVLYARYK